MNKIMCPISQGPFCSGFLDKQSPLKSWSTYAATKWSVVCRDPFFKLSRQNLSEALKLFNSQFCSPKIETGVNRWGYYRTDPHDSNRWQLKAQRWKAHTPNKALGWQVWLLLLFQYVGNDVSKPAMNTGREWVLSRILPGLVCFLFLTSPQLHISNKIFRFDFSVLT